MTDDDRLLRPPADRDVTPDLRARVLLNATDPATPTPRRRRSWLPALAGLAAAAVVVAVTVSVVRNDDGREPAPITGGPTTSAPTVDPHATVAVDIRALGDPEKQAVRRACLGADPAEPAQHVLGARLLHSAFGDIRAAAFSNVPTGNQYFCTPFGEATSTRQATQVTNATPFVVVPGSHVSEYTPDPDGSGGTTLVDGAWFSLNLGYETVEARVVVDGDAGQWHATAKFSQYVFASAWRHLTAEELRGDVEVEYRVITADQQALPVPALD